MNPSCCRVRWLPTILAACAFAVAAAWVPVSAQPARGNQPGADAGLTAWSVSGGELELRWNRELMAELGVEPGLDGAASAENASVVYPLSRAGILVMQLHGAKLAAFDHGQLVLQRGPIVSIRGEALDLTRMALRPVADEPTMLDVFGSDGIAWFRLIRPMYEFSDDRRSIDVATMDLTVTSTLAMAIGRPEAVGWTVADVRIVANTTALPAPQAPAATFNWPGDPAPNGGVYQADLFMKEMRFQYSRCDGCEGVRGSGRVVFTPTSTLRNNGNNGYVTGYTVPGDPLGWSTALWPAGIAWYSKFSGEFAPYQNDQHPYLIWNMYRIDADGSLQQIGRSGVKHAFLTNNIGCFDPDDHSPHVLGRGCEDTYTVSHNDNDNSLGPRSEVIPATGQWARCGSIYDPSCTGTSGSSGYSSFDQRMVVNETQISPVVNPGSTYLFESWYVARDDINIYNSMATLRAVPTYTTGWNVNNQTNYRLGPAIDRWVDPIEPGDNSASTELVTSEGRARVAMRARFVGTHTGGWRYDYAFANFDFARASTEGSEPNLRVLKSAGFDRFVLPVGNATVTDMQFRDGDGNPANDWQFVQEDGNLIITAPAGGNWLEWGTLYSVSFQSPSPPVVSSVALRPADGDGTALFVIGDLKAPALGDLIWRNGFDSR